MRLRTCEQARTWTALRALAMPALGIWLGAIPVLAQPLPSGNDDVDAIQVRSNFYMITGAGGNIAAQIGPAGVILVDTGSAQMQTKVLAALKKLSSLPIRYILDTSADADHVGGNTLSKSGQSVIGPTGAGQRGFGFAEDMINNGGAASPR